MANNSKELTPTERALIEKHQQRTTPGCPICQHKSFEFAPYDTTTPFFVLYCENCGFKMEHFVNLLLSENAQDSDPQRGQSDAQ